MSGFSSDTNARQVADSLRRAADALEDLDAVNEEAGQVVLAAARPPRGATGELAAKMTARATGREVVVTSMARHFTFVHWGAPRINVRAQPFILAAARLTRDQVVELYLTHMKDTLRKAT